MRADLAWFLEFMQDWNGTSLIPAPQPHRTIQVDACLTGIGATDGVLAYAAVVAPDHDPVSNITELEAVNVIIALHSFISSHDAGGHIHMQCDNLPAVQALTSGRAHNQVLAECARAAWMLQAIYAVRISYSHIPGQNNQVADALSRAHVTPAYHRLAREHITDSRLSLVYPCSHILSNIHPPILCRSGAQLACPPGSEETGQGTSPGHSDSTQGYSGGAGDILPQVRHGPPGNVPNRRMYVGGIPGHDRHFPGHGEEQAVPCSSVHPPGGGDAGRLQPYKSIPGPGCSAKAQGPPSKNKGGEAALPAAYGATTHTPTGRRNNATHGNPADLLRRAKTVRGGATVNQVIRPDIAPDTQRCDPGKPDNSKDKVGEKPTAVQSNKNRYIIPHRRRADMPSLRDPPRYTGTPGTAGPRPPTGLHTHGHSDAHIILTTAVGQTDDNNGGWSSTAHRTYIATDAVQKINDALSNSIIY